jgi:metallo-beta-lactamase class B
MEVFMTKSKWATLLLVAVVGLYLGSTPVMAQSWLKGYKYGEKTATVPYSTADLEYGKTIKWRIDGDRDKVTAEKMNKQIFGPFRVAGDTYYFGTQQTSSVLVKTPEGNVILNWPWGGDYRWGDKDTSLAIIAEMEKAGLKLKDVKYFLSSEQHGDHNGGVAEIISKTGAKLITMEGDDQGMENQPPIGFPQPKVSQVIKNGFVLKFGGKTFTANHTKGHTPGSTTWVWQEKENGISYNVAVPCCWAMPGNVVSNPEVSTERLKQTWQMLKSLPIDIPLGHHPWQFLWLAKQARLASGEDRISVFVDPAGYRGWAAVYELLFLDTLAKQLKDGPPPPRQRPARGGPPAPKEPGND